MFSPIDLLRAARLLAATDTASTAHIHRAISTAYYALFHHLLSAAATRFLRDGNRNGAAYSAVYRGFSHGRMRAVCEALNVPTLGKAFARQYRRTSASQKIRAFASIFLALQEARSIADYDPVVAFAASDVEEFIEKAEAAIAMFDQAEPDEQDDVLALMLTQARN